MADIAIHRITSIGAEVSEYDDFTCLTLEVVTDKGDKDIIKFFCYHYVDTDGLYQPLPAVPFQFHVALSRALQDREPRSYKVYDAKTY